MTDSVFTSFGGLDLPVSDQDVTDSLSSLDPARDRMLEWFAAAINAEFGSAWTEATNALEAGHKLAGTQPVQDKLPFAPSPKLMKQRKCGFPLLAIHRVGTPTFEVLTLEEDRMVQEWHLHHILGPMDLEAERRILDIGQAVGKALAVTIRCEGHPAYESGSNQLEAGDLHTLTLKSMTGPGPAQFDGDENATYWSTLYTLETHEHSSPNLEHMPPFNGADFDLDVGGAGSTDLNFHFLQASTDPEYQDP